MGRNLFDGSSDSETEVAGIKTNQDYAKSYNKFREKELIKKLKDRQKNNDDESSSDEDSESSDEEFSANKRFDEEFFKTLSSLKSKNPDIYNKNTKFFKNEDDNNETGKEKTKKQKAMTIKDYERKVILEKGGIFEDDEDVDCDEEEIGRATSPSYVQEQSKLRNEIKKALDLEENEDEGFGGLFRRREKTNEQTAQEQEEYTTWLAGKKEKIGESAARTLNPLKQYWSNPNLSKQEQFLRDYVLNHGFHNRDIDEIPTYDEVVAHVSEDEKELEKQEEFEHKYNFRFEEPDQNFIQRYPRTIHISVRKKDESRKEKRTAARERKLKEKEQKFKELEMLKEIKRKEILEKIQKLKEVTGNEELPFKEEELDADFDPDAHDRRMQEVFNEQYYGVDEGEEKPECPEIEELKVEDWDNFDPEKDVDWPHDEYEPHCEDEDFNMDCDYDPQAAKEKLQNELIENTKSRRKGRRRNKFMEMIKKEKPPFNPDDEKTYNEYIDEYYKMDCEDIIGDTPCRFKYVETIPNDFGLTIDEILLAKNRELNQWVSLKKTVQIKPKQTELRDKRLFKLKAKNEALKRKIFPSIYGPPSEDENDEVMISKNGSTTKRQSVDGSKAGKSDSAKKKKKKKKKKANAGEDVPSKSKDALTPPDTPTDSAETSTGCKVKPEHTNVHSNSEANANEVKSENQSETSTSEKKKKKKAKNIQPDIDVNNKVPTKKSEGAANIPNKSQIKKKKTQSPKNINRKSFKPASSETDIYSKLSDDRLRAYGLNPRKFRNQMKFGNKQQNPFKKSSNGKNQKKKKKSNETN